MGYGGGVSSTPYGTGNNQDTTKVGYFLPHNWMNFTLFLVIRNEMLI
ncbi:MAG: hypothetical protein ACRC4S_00640 [Cetobacterium sp.]